MKQLLRDIWKGFIRGLVDFDRKKPERKKVILIQNETVWTVFRSID